MPQRKPKLTVPPSIKGPGFAVLAGVKGNPLPFYERLRHNSSDVVSFRVVPDRVYVLKEPDLIQELLVSRARHFHKGRSLELARGVWGNGLLNSEGEFYLRQRRLMQPAFHSQQINGFGETMISQAERAMASWRDGESRDLYAEMMSLTLGVVSETLFGSDVESDAARVRNAMSDLMDSFPLLMLPFGKFIQRLPIKAMKKLRNARTELDRVLYRLINTRRQQKTARRDLLSMLLATQDPENNADAGMTDNQVHDEAMIIFLAGHETTSVAFGWTWFLLSQHPEIEARLHAEVDKVPGDSRPTLADLPQLTYTRNVVTESMRLYPPVWNITRRAIQPCKIGRYDVPVRTLVQSSQWLLHRDERFYPNPAEFRPERWTPEFRERLPKFAYFPFGGGLRGCIGENFAWMELVLIVAAIARRWRFRINNPEQVVPTPLFTLRFKNGLLATLVKR